jgi:hypothetical protein
MFFKYIIYMNLPNTLVNSKNVPIDGGIRPSMSMFGARVPEMSVALIDTITKKNEISKVIPKNSAAAIK